MAPRAAIDGRVAMTYGVRRRRCYQSKHDDGDSNGAALRSGEAISRGYRGGRSARGGRATPVWAVYGAAWEGWPPRGDVEGGVLCAR